MALMKKKELEYIKKQLHIIQKKVTIEELNRYEVSLGAAKLNTYTKDTLFKGCDVRRKELSQVSPMVVDGDYDLDETA